MCACAHPRGGPAANSPRHFCPAADFGWRATCCAPLEVRLPHLWRAARLHLVEIRRGRRIAADKTTRRSNFYPTAGRLNQFADLMRFIFYRFWGTHCRGRVSRPVFLAKRCAAWRAGGPGPYDSVCAFVCRGAHSGNLEKYGVKRRAGETGGHWPPLQSGCCIISGILYQKRRLSGCRGRRPRRPIVSVKPNHAL